MNTVPKFLLVTAVGVLLPLSVAAQIAVSSNDNKATLVNGVSTVIQNPAPDTVAIIDLGAKPPRLLAEIDAPSSVVGPPSNVAITPDGRLALVSSSQKNDPANPKAQIPDNRISIIDLKSSPPKVIAVVEAGLAPSGISINRDGTLALVANRSEGTVTVLKISGNDVRKIDTVTVGTAASGASHAAISPDGKMALVTKDNDNAVAVLSISGEKVEYAKRDIFPGIRPYGLVIAPDGKSAVVANVGRGVGDSDTIASIDLTGKWPRVVEHLTVGAQPEGISMSADGKLLALSVLNGSNKAKEFPWHSATGKVVLVSLDGTRLTKLSEAPVGAWCQGSAFSKDGRTLVVQNMLDKNLAVFAIDNGKLADTGQRIALKGSPVGIRVLY
jgi:DNA-binding beta-propeller fold protein YncE